MPDMHLSQSGFTYNACGLFTITEERIKKVKETGDWRSIYQNELGKAEQLLRINHSILL